MFKVASLVAAMALFVGAPVFAQGANGANNSAAPSTDANNTPGDAGNAGQPHHRHMHHHRNGDEANSTNTDMDADKLNACWASANPTSAQENCLRHAEHS